MTTTVTTTTTTQTHTLLYLQTSIVKKAKETELQVRRFKRKENITKGSSVILWLNLRLLRGRGATDNCNKLRVDGIKVVYVGRKKHVKCILKAMGEPFKDARQDFVCVNTVITTSL